MYVGLQQWWVGGAGRWGKGEYGRDGGCGSIRSSWEWDNYRPLHQLKLGQQAGRKEVRKDEGGGNECGSSPLLHNNTVVSEYELKKVERAFP